MQQCTNIHPFFVHLLYPRLMMKIALHKLWRNRIAKTIIYPAYYLFQWHLIYYIFTMTLSNLQIRCSIMWCIWYNCFLIPLKTFVIYQLIVLNVSLYLLWSSLACPNRLSRKTWTSLNILLITSSVACSSRSMASQLFLASFGCNWSIRFASSSMQASISSNLTSVAWASLLIFSARRCNFSSLLY